MKKISKLGLTALAGGALVLGGMAAPANAEPTGQYDYTCIDSTGTSYNWNGNPPASCNGWMDVRINGQLIDHVDMTNAYIQDQLSKPGVVVSLDCAVSGAGLLLSIPGTTTIVGTAATAVALLAVGMTCP
jgi:hypothetical protein